MVKNVENQSDLQHRVIDLTYEEINLKLGSKERFGLFPTLDQVLQQVSANIGILVELKFPQMSRDGKMEHQDKSNDVDFPLDYMEKNAYIDRILNIVFESVCLKPRNIAFLSFDADIALMVKLKQNVFPVFGVTRGCLFSEDYMNHVDNRINTFGGAMMWSRFCGLDGIVSRFYESLKPEYLQCKQHQLVLFVYGDIPATKAFFEESQLIGLDGLILDDVVNLHSKMFFN